jgi:predicted ATP-grasp superfamily ATP-dependent carboligase
MIRGADAQSCSAAATEAVSRLSGQVGAVGVAIILLAALWVLMPRGRKK